MIALNYKVYFRFPEENLLKSLAKTNKQQQQSQIISWLSNKFSGYCRDHHYLLTLHKWPHISHILGFRQCLGTNTGQWVVSESNKYHFQDEQLRASIWLLIFSFPLSLKPQRLWEATRYWNFWQLVSLSGCVEQGFP